MNRHYFLGANTPHGFYSYFDSLLDHKSARKIYCIKGGPGTGKSSLMKKIAKWGREQGFSVDSLHCSSDPDSLDGVVIPELGVGMVDGTSPHIVDPKYPGCVDVILNMGEFWDETAIHTKKEEILTYNKTIKACYERAYMYLRVAGDFYEAIQQIHKACIDEEAVKDVADALTKDIKPVSKKSGTVRKLFMTGITPYGMMGFSDTFLYPNIYVLSGKLLGGADRVLSRVLSAYVDCGYDVEAYFDPFRPNEGIAHLVVPEKGIFITSEDPWVQYPSAECERIDLDAQIDRDVFSSYEETLLEYKDWIKRSLEHATAVIKKAKATHDLLEGCYIPYMDFKKMNNLKKQVLKELEKIAQKKNPA